MDLVCVRQRNLVEKYYNDNISSDQAALKKLRKLFSEKAESCLAQNLYDIRDIELVGRSDWTVRRFLNENHGDVNKALKQLDKCLQWRRNFGINDPVKEDGLSEFLEEGAVFAYPEDKDNRIVVYIRVKIYKRIPLLMPRFRKFLMGVIDKVDAVADILGYTFVFDFTDVSLSNVDMGFLHFIITTLKNNYPCGLRRVIAYNLPWILKGLWATVKIWLGPDQDLIKFANGDEIQEFIVPENLPKYMGGNCPTSIKATATFSPPTDIDHVRYFTRITAFDSDET